VVIGAETLPAAGEVFLIASDGKGKRVPVADFPLQGRYGRGVIAWEGATLTGMTLGKPSAVVTLHLNKLAPKSTRLDAAPARKRSAVRGGPVLDLKPGDAVTWLTSGWELERYAGKVSTGSTRQLELKAAAGKPASKKPAAKKPATKKPTAPKPAPGKPVAKKPAVKKPAPKKPAAKK
jgi:hypothetical protein